MKNTNTAINVRVPLTQSRRRVLKSISATAMAVGLAGCSNGGSDETKDGWTQADSPTGNTLYDAAASQNGPYAVGGGGRILTRRSGAWKVVVKSGPTGEGYTLRAADTSADKQRVWVAGGSGVVGEYNVTNGTLTDYSAPKGKTSTWEDIAVTGPANTEHVFLINGSGEFLSGRRVSEEKIKWDDVVKPGGGSSAKSVEFLDLSTGYVCDTNTKVYATTDGGANWQTIGIDEESVGLYDVAAVDPYAITVAGGNGSVFQYDGTGWTKQDAGGATLYAIDRTNDIGLIVGGSGSVFRRTGKGWRREKTPTGNTLRGVVLGKKSPDVAVGSSGTIIERSQKQ